MAARNNFNQNLCHELCKKNNNNNVYTGKYSVSVW